MSGVLSGGTAAAAAAVEEDGLLGKLPAGTLPPASGGATAAAGVEEMEGGSGANP